MSLNTHLLSLLVLLPVAGAVLVAVTRRESESLQKALGLAVSGVAFALSLLLVVRSGTWPGCSSPSSGPGSRPGGSATTSGWTGSRSGSSS